MSVYISGPMRGIKHFNFPAFYECEEYLEWGGWKGQVINPARKDVEEHGFDPFPDETQPLTAEMLHQWMRRDLADVAGCDAIFLLPGWKNSTGAKREVQVARWCGLKIHEYDPDAPRGRRVSTRLPDEDVDAVLSGGIDSPATVSAVTMTEPDQTLASLPTKTPSPLAMTDVEIRTVNSLTGGEKGVKPARFDLLPAGPLTAVATHYGIGATKYEDRNWERGYEWSKSFGALMRHAWAFWGGEDLDPETGSPHLAAVVFHALAMLEWASTHPEMDDRP